MQKLNLPPIEAKITLEGNRQRIFDIIRKKYVALTPEEWVRQHFVHYLLSLEYSASLMAVEKLVVVNELKQRADVVVYNKKRAPVMIVECKSPTVPLTNDTLAQAARYNIRLGVSFLVITNGLNHYCIKINRETGKAEVMNALPTIDEVENG
ncbi:type I restriction enzyme HsdR N-terminal domain-containing protein [Alkalitalea saponilacus]|uniref:Type I restriction enzyme R protein N terminus (HSDR_N) n=1 Tax=Alkalitalea saponilacus TaxID=889453 RepID=A0A1T5GT61_9BACT|nr:type I restriction enzyme HsdR N-terminal domain-containing protein [Alkalitalea saponilacus]ASB48196.1 restriction endonuclease subunit R [Alkalitalea saponilacus]SKC11652.1 Type I restriction enzyme R protein N terminus (HSDR_N) [Alkalitalea saponilacus]